MTDTSPVIFGEVLFDCFPDGSAILGGAPFNVAWHLHGMGLAPLMVSSVGDDTHGKTVLQKMQQWGMDIVAMQVNDSYPTGQVAVSFNQGEPLYEIVPDQAYDHVALAPLKKVLQGRNPALLYHGTLALRTQNMKEQLAMLINDYHLPTFVDVNLRAPWWSEQEVQAAIANAKWVKLNQDELAIVAGKRIHNEEDLRQAADALYAANNLELLIVTLGENGAICLHAGNFIQGAPAPVDNLKDTVGAGDAFSAVMIAGIVYKWPLKQTLDRALKFASTVCQMRGATSMDHGMYQELID